MKKNVLALSITAALVGLGFAGGAQAIGLANPGNPIPAGVASTLGTSVDGIGHFLYVPYYSVQGSIGTMINIVNTDTTNGKAVKVRFRGAGNSDDVFDFQVFLSPGDVWTANVSKNAAGLAQLTTNDISCTKPDKAVLNVTPFSTIRLDSRRASGVANETREGYVEIFNMADIPPATALYTAIKHVAGTPHNGNPPCRTTPTNAAWTALESDPLGVTEANAKGLYAPTTGLFANWIILDAVNAGAWSGAATAIVATDDAGVATTGSITYFPQTNEPLGFTSTRLAQFTADPILRLHPTMAAVYDLPDFSIPYTVSPDPTQQVALLSTAIATRSIMNEYLTDPSINATTDWVLSMPTRRYSVAYDYTSSNATNGRVFTTLPIDYFTVDNTTAIDRQVCVTGTSITPYDREETSPTTPGAGVIVSPQVPGEPTSFNVCGEASVLAFNNGDTTVASGTLHATVARSAIDTPTGFSEGWANLATPGLLATEATLTNGLPILGYEAVRAIGNIGGQAFGAALPHRTDRVQK